MAQASILQNSWFSGDKLSIEKVIALTLAWVHSYNMTQAVHETSLDNETTSAEMVIDWYNNNSWEVSADRIMKHHAGPIGSPGLTVRSMSLSCARESHRSRFIEGQWVFGGICRETKP